jgi:hypothetical protein
MLQWNIGADETVLGFPFTDFKTVSEYVDYLETKRIPNSRSKKTYSSLKAKTSNDD